MIFFCLFIAISTDLPFGIEEILMVSPSNVFVFEMEGDYIEDILMRIAGVEIVGGSVHFYGEEVLVTKDGLPVSLEDIIPQSVARIEFLGETSIYGQALLNFTTKRFEGEIPYSRLWLKTGDTQGFEFKRGLKEGSGMYICTHIADNPMYEANIGYERAGFGIYAIIKDRPSIELSANSVRLTLSEEHSSIRGYFKRENMGLGFGVDFDSSASFFLTSKFEPLLLFYIAPQIGYRDSIIPKVSFGLIPFYEAMLFAWATPHIYGGGARFKKSSVFFSSPDNLGVIFQTGIGKVFELGMGSSKTSFFLQGRFRFRDDRLRPYFSLDNKKVVLGLGIIDLDINASIKKDFPPSFTLSWEFWD